MKKEKTFETILTLVTASVIFGLLLKIKLLLTISIILGLVGIFIKPLAEIISKMWLNLSEMLGTISSKIILSIVFFIFLVPISFLYRLFNKDTLKIKNIKESTFYNRDHKYTKEDFEHPW
jgi:hypothetical protein